MDRGHHKKNLTKIKRRGYIDNTNIIIGTVNIQSIKNKDLQVSELLDDYGIDVLILTETWLTNSENNKQWLEITQLNRPPYKFLTKKQTQRQGWRTGSFH